MSKSVLVIDTPDKCFHCPLLNGNDECIVQDDSANFNASDSWDELMKGCPLKPLPEKITRVAVTDHWNSIKAGWNNCIDAITGGNADD